MNYMLLNVLGIFAVSAFGLLVYYCVGGRVDKQPPHGQKNDNKDPPARP
ncbi:hypothetical protein [Candidatus Desulfovibrio trichonymphae]|uniref:Uncharacterized protein n=1 Tax=Candidatus Desulfovibrio trichonymphae TaxID=1725232 RepID=A0A1J1E2K0_9BACT|nr:hypothetical protein [Candidatus Desulfovibrio trichonymphae]BAV92099.1 conserved hypothetical protein [Candidatus Desulfovibrio trichonymphae]